MIQSLELENFKCFEKIKIDFKNLTLLTGVNSGGKSSIIQSILCMKQNFEILNQFPDTIEMLKSKNYTDFSIGRIGTEGKYTNLGTANNLLYENAEDDFILFRLTLEDKEKKKGSLFLKTQIDKNNPKYLTIDNSASKIDFTKILVDEENFSYLSADRITPKLQYDYSKENVLKGNLGNKGEYSIHYLAVNSNESLKLNELKHPNSNSLSFRENVARWLERISIGIDISSGVNDEMQYSYLKYSYNGGKEYFPQNVGFGITYVLPIIITLLKAERGDIIIIENPESHLHPAAQAEIANLCCKVAAQGVQLIIETHSDHFLNAIRVAVKNKIIENADTQIYFFTKVEQKSIAEKISLDSNGKVDKWPKGFFDEWDIQLEKLLW